MLKSFVQKVVSKLVQKIKQIMKRYTAQTKRYTARQERYTKTKRKDPVHYSKTKIHYKGEKIPYRQEKIHCTGLLNWNSLGGGGVVGCAGGTRPWKQCWAYWKPLRTLKQLHD